MFIGELYNEGGTTGGGREVIISLKDVGMAYDLGHRLVYALSDLNLEVRSRDFVVICGPSGCGKSTLLNVIIGAEENTSGRVTVRGKNLFSMDEEKRGIFRSKKMGVIYQRPYWIRSLSSLQNVALPLMIEGASEKRATQRAHDLMVRLNLTGLIDSYPAQLSGGEQQKLAFARAIIADPHIIVADEPTGNLDTTSPDELMAMFHGLHADMKKTIIMVTHNQAYWNLGTRRVEMRDGRITNGGDIHG